MSHFSEAILHPKSNVFRPFGVFFDTHLVHNYFYSSLKYPLSGRLNRKIINHKDWCKSSNRGGVAGSTFWHRLIAQVCFSVRIYIYIYIYIRIVTHSYSCLYGNTCGQNRPKLLIVYNYSVPNNNLPFISLIIN